MDKQKKLSIYLAIKKELLGMGYKETVAFFAPNGKENVVVCFVGGWDINDYPMTHLPEIVAILTKDTLKYWEQNPEEAKASGLL